MPDSDRFTDEQWRQADALLDLGAVPRRLSGLLAQTRSTDPELPEPVALRVLHAVDPAVSTARQQGDQVGWARALGRLATEPMPWPPSQQSGRTP